MKQKASILSRSLLFSILSLLCLGADARAQDITGRVTGTVTDPSGAVISGATVEVTNQGTNVSTTATTSGAGTYSVSLLPIGVYRITVMAPGFKTSTVNDVRITIGSSIREDVRLEIGVVTDNVDVTTETPPLETQAKIATTVEGRIVRELPVAGRDYLRLATLGPGVVQRQTSSVATLQASEYLGSNIPTIAGGRGEGISFTMGGVNVNNRRLNIPMEKPSLDSIGELTVLVNNYSAEYGQGDGQVIVEFRSGTNQFHGSVYNYFRNDALNARGFFDNEKAKVRHNQFGVAVGGPIFKNRTFFFANYEGIRNPSSVIQGANLPNEALLNGDFSNFRDANGNLIIIYDPATTDPVTGLRQPFPGNRIPPQRISSIAKSLYALYGAPVSSLLVPGGNNILKALSRNQPVDQLSLKIDHNFASGDLLATRYSFTDPRSENEQIVSAASSSGSLRNQIIGQTWTHVFNQNIVNELRAGYARQRSTNTPSKSLSEQNLQQAAGITRPLSLNFLPRLAFQSETGTPTFNEMPQIIGSATGSGEVQQSYQVVDNLSWTRGSHSFKFGIDVRRRRWDTIGEIGGGGGTLQSTGAFTSQLEPDPARAGLFRPAAGGGSALADFLLGQLRNVDFGTGSNIFALRDTVFSWYAQDNFQINTRLNATLGLRWDYQSPIADKYGRQSFVVGAPLCPDGCLVNDGTFGGTFDPITNPFPGMRAIRRGGIRPDRNNFGPRASLAYKWTDNTVVRLGAGLFYGLWEQNNLANPSQPPFGSGFNLNDALVDRSNLSNFTQSRFHISTIFPPPSQTSTGFTARGFSPNFFFDINNKQPSFVNANLSVQHAFSHNLTVEVGYMFKGGRNLTNFENQNPCTVDPCLLDSEGLPIRTTWRNFGGVIMAATSGSNNYNAGYVEVDRRLSRGLQFLASYTWSKNLSVGFDSLSNDIFLGSTYIEPLRDFRRNPKKLSVIDVPHRFVLSGLYELPFGRGKRFARDARGALNQLVGGWQLSWITVFQSGPVVDLNSFGAARFRPGRGQDLRRMDFRSTGFFFDPALFQSPGQGGVEGDPVPFNHFRGAGINNWDISVLKDFNFRESHRLELRADFFNAFNHAQFEVPGHVIFFPGFGKFQATNPGFSERGVRAPRNIVLALKYIF